MMSVDIPRIKAASQPYSSPTDLPGDAPRSTDLITPKQINSPNAHGAAVGFSSPGLKRPKLAYGRFSLMRPFRSDPS